MVPVDIDDDSSDEIPDILERLNNSLIEKYKNIDIIKHQVSERQDALKQKKKKISDKAEIAYERCLLAQQQLRVADAEVSMIL